MRLKPWYALPIAAIALVAVFMIVLVDDIRRPKDIQPSVSETGQAEVSPVAEQPPPVEFDSGNPTGTTAPDPVDESTKQRELTAQLERAGAEKRVGIAPKILKLDSPPMAGSHLAAPQNETNRN